MLEEKLGKHGVQATSMQVIYIMVIETLSTGCFFSEFGPEQRQLQQAQAGSSKVLKALFHPVAGARRFRLSIRCDHMVHRPKGKLQPHCHSHSRCFYQKEKKKSLV